MNQNVHHSQCPVCGSLAIGPVLTATDHTVSGDKFVIWECAGCSLRFTQDVPGPDSIGKYYQSEDYISHSNTSRGIINRMYQLVRKRTLKQKRKLIGSVTRKNHGNILDIGSGTGSFIKEMKIHGWKVMGLEPDSRARETAKNIFNTELENIDKLFDLPAGSYDAITLWHVLEHVHDLQPYIIQLKKLLNQNGSIIIAVPNYTSFDASYYKENWAAYDVPRHLYHFSPLAMQQLTERNEMKIIACKPMWFDSFYVSLLSSKYKNAAQVNGRGKTKWLMALWIGTRSNLKALNNKKKCSSVVYVISK